MAKCAGVAEWLSRQPRDLKMMGSQIQKWQDSWWASARRGSNPFPGANF